jgi:hypothetical protein
LWFCRGWRGTCCRNPSRRRISGPRQICRLASIACT